MAKLALPDPVGATVRQVVRTIGGETFTCCLRVRAWVLPNEDKARFARAAELRLRGPAIDLETEIPFTGRGLGGIFFIDPKRAAREVRDWNLPEAEHSAAETCIHTIGVGEQFTLSKRSNGPDQVWTLPRADVARFSRAANWPVRDTELLAPERGEIVISGRGLDARYINGSNALERIVRDFKLPIASRHTSTTVTRTVNSERFVFTRRQSEAQIVWTLPESDHLRFGKVTSLKPAVEAEQLGSGEFGLTRNGLNTVIEDGYHLAPTVRTRLDLPAPEAATSERIERELSGERFAPVRRYSGNNLCWALPISDLERFCSAFEVIPRVDARIEAAVRSLGVADAVALLRHDQELMFAFLIAAHPELSPDDIGAVMRKVLTGLSIAEYDPSFATFDSTLGEVRIVRPVQKDLQTSESHLAIEGVAPKGAREVSIYGSYQCLVSVLDDGSFETFIPVPHIGAINSVKLVAVDRERRVRGEVKDLSVLQTGVRKPPEEALLDLAFERKLLSERLQGASIRRSILELTLEVSFLKYFTESTVDGFAHLASVIEAEQSAARRALLRGIADKFLMIDALELPISEGQQVLFFQKYIHFRIQELRRAGHHGAILALDTGCGKSLLGLLASRGEDLTVLAPAALLTTWVGEERKFFDTSELILLNDDFASRDERLAAGRPRRLVTNYEYVRDAPESRLAKLSPGPNGVLIVDEAKIVGRESKQTEAIRSLEAGFKLLETATPFDTIQQLGSMLGVIRPNDARFSSPQAFAREFPTDSSESVGALRLLAMESTVRIRAPQVFREYDPDVPLEQQRRRLPRVRMHDPTGYPLHPEQCKAIHLLFSNPLGFQERYRPRDDAALRTAGSSFAVVEAARQIQNNPAYFGMPEIPSPKHAALDELLRPYLFAEKRILVFTRYVSELHAFQNRYAHHGVCTLYGGVRCNSSGYRIDTSGAVVRYETDRRGGFLFDPMGNLIPSTRMSGSSPIKELDYQRFLYQNSKNHRIMLATLDTANLGLTLTATDVVVFADLPRAFSGIRQGLGRAVRIDDDRRKYYVDVHSLEARYPSDLADYIARAEIDRYFSMGTWDQVHFEKLRYERDVSNLVLDWMGDPSELPRLRAHYSSRMPFLFQAGGTDDPFFSVLSGAEGACDVSTDESFPNSRM